MHTLRDVVSKPEGTSCIQKLRAPFKDATIWRQVLIWLRLGLLHPGPLAQPGRMHSMTAEQDDRF